MFEGPDGSGKSTQLKRLIALCGAHGVPACEVREPGGTPVGERIRDILLDKAHADMALRCEMLLYMASRAQLVERRIAPALARGELVIADRFVASTFAYQGAAGGLPKAEIQAAANVAIQKAWPDLTLVFDVDEQTAAKRSGVTSAPSDKKKGGQETVHMFADRMEDRTREFRRKVRQSYLDQAKEDPGRFRVIDASRPPEEVWTGMLAALGGWARA